MRRAAWLLAVAGVGVAHAASSDSVGSVDMFFPPFTLYVDLLGDSEQVQVDVDVPVEVALHPPGLAIPVGPGTVLGSLQTVFDPDDAFVPATDCDVALAADRCPGPRDCTLRCRASDPTVPVICPQPEGEGEARCLLDPDHEGVLSLTMSEPSQRWSVDVPGATGGRVFTSLARFFSPAGEADAHVHDWFVLLPSDSGRPGLIQVRADQLALRRIGFAASRTGIPSHPARSARIEHLELSPPQVVDFDPTPGAPGDEERILLGDLRLYIDQPQVWSDDPAEISARSAVLEDVGIPDVEDGWLPDCADVVVEGIREARIGLTTAESGTAHLVCDADGDGVYELASDDDVHTIASVGGGATEIRWDGRDAQGQGAEPGILRCVVWHMIAETHLMVFNVEIADPGLRMFEVKTSGDRAPLPMFWNDGDIPDQMPMRDCALGAKSSPVGGLLPLDIDDSDVPEPCDGESRGWGTFDPVDPALSKGRDAWLDTWTWVDGVVSTPLTLRVAPPAFDADGDDLPDVLEECVHGTRPDDADTDGDGTSDGAEVAAGRDPLVPDAPDTGSPTIDTAPDGPVGIGRPAWFCGTMPAGMILPWWWAVLVVRRRR